MACEACGRWAWEKTFSYFHPCPSGACVSRLAEARVLSGLLANGKGGAGNLLPVATAAGLWLVIWTDGLAAPDSSPRTYFAAFRLARAYGANRVLKIR